MAKQENNNTSFMAKVGGFFKKLGKTIARWTKRTVIGVGKEEVDVFSVEAIDSPGKAIVKNFFRNKLAVVALVIFIVMFFLAIVGPYIWPTDVNYTQPLHKNLAPGYNYMSVPSSIKNDIKDISSYSYFSVGLSEDGKVAVWGNTKIANSPTNADIANIPDEIKNANVKFIAAGLDHAIAITDEGRVIGWGEYNNAQYGSNGSLYGARTVVNMPKVLQTGKINVNDVKQLACGYQVSAIVMKDGSIYFWGNYQSGALNAKDLMERTDVEKVGFLKGNIVALLKDGSLWLGKAEGQYGTCKTADGTTYPISEYFAGRTVTDFACANSGAVVVLDGKEIVTIGIVSSSVPMPTLEAGETVTAVGAGSEHFTVTTSKNRVYAFGDDSLKQAEGFDSIEEGSKVFTGSFQNYVVDKDGKLTASKGLKGYLFGTDDMGRDVFVRIIHGGKMTMTIGAVAVVISSIIGIIVGVLSGYFGGWVDILLMRVTEIFSSLPFLPFAIILSSVLAGKAITENMRMFMIMVVLGVLSWTGLARMVRGQILAEREKEFVIAAKAMGVKESRIAFKHILPNVISVILVNMTLDFAGCMLTESSLSYLGFGVALPRPSWGNMLNGCLNEIVISQFWWRWLFPSIFLLVTTICINIIGDTLRDVMDPKSSAER